MVEATQTLRDPTIDHGRYRHRGLLEYPILLHRSVEERLEVATDGYGPNNLPALYEVDNGTARIRPAKARLVQTGSQDHRNLEACLLVIGDRIKLRRFWYFASFWFALALVLKPWWPQFPVLSQLVGTVDVRINTGLFEDAANAFLPSMAKLWTDAIFSDPVGSGIVIVLLLITNAMGSAQEGATADTAGRMWRERFSQVSNPANVPATGPALGLVNRLRSAWQSLRTTVRAHLGGAAVAGAPSHGGISAPHVGAVEAVLLRLARPFHTNNLLAGPLAIFKWHVIPLVLGFVIWIFNWYAAFAVMGQISLQLREPSDVTCDARATDLGTSSVAVPAIGLTDRGTADRPTATDHVFRVDIAKPCSILYTPKLDTRASGHFHLGVELVDTKGVPAKWRDASFEANPEGWVDRGWTATAIQWATKPFLRVMTAELFQPIIEFRRPGKGGFMGDDGIFMLHPTLKPAGSNYWAGEFDLPSRSDGEGRSDIAFFLNDAYFPIDLVGAGRDGCNPSQPAPDHWWGWAGRINWSGIFQHRSSDDIAGRYANNCGTAVVHIIELPFEHSDTEQRVEAIGEP